MRGPGQKGMLVCKLSGDVRQVRNMVTKLRQIPSLGPLVQFDERDIPQVYLCRPAPRFYLEYTGEVAIITGPYKIAVEPLEHFWMKELNMSFTGTTFVKNMPQAVWPDFKQDVHDIADMWGFKAVDK